MSLLAAYAPSDVVLFVARIGGGLAAGMAYPTTLALITALWAPGAGRTKSIALWSGLGGAIAALGPLLSGAAARALLVGLGVPADAAARRRRDRHGLAPRAGARERGHRAGRQPRRDPLARPRRCADPGDQLRAGPERNDADASCSRSSRSSHSRSSTSGSAGRQNPLYDLEVAARPTVLGRGLRGDHRVRLADGRDVHRAAVPAERARLLDARRRPRRSCPPRSAWCSWLRGRRRSSNLTARASRCSLGYVFVLLGFLTMLLLWKESISYWKVGLGYAFVGIGVGLAGHSCLALAHGLGPGAGGWGWRPGPPTCSVIWAARSCSRSSARC